MLQSPLCSQHTLHGPRQKPGYTHNALALNREKHWVRMLKMKWEGKKALAELYEVQLAFGCLEAENGRSMSRASVLISLGASKGFRSMQNNTAQLTPLMTPLHPTPPSRNQQ